MKRKRIVILGSTGSIGRQTLQVIRSIKNRFEIIGLVARANWRILAQQIKEFQPRYACLFDKSAVEQVKQCLMKTSNRRLRTKLLTDQTDLKRLITHPSVDLVVSAIAGADGLPMSIWALAADKLLALANKESLVMAGSHLLELARAHNTEIIPIDSEHSAIFQALRSGQRSEVKRVILTTSGGPFYQATPAQMKKVTVQQALNHPVWKMGPKITIDSATLMNKALEIIEAKWLFGLEPEQIKVVYHPQAIIHSMVEFHDGSVVAQMSQPDMRLPIKFALGYPERLNTYNHSYLFQNKLTLDFRSPDLARFPALRLGYRAARLGGTAGAVLNAANEEAVKLFTQKKILLTDITLLTERVLNAHRLVKNPTLNAIYQADHWARVKMQEFCHREEFL